MEALASATGLHRLAAGKVRERYAVGDDLLLVATDRVSAFDAVLPTPIPEKGRVLTGLTAFWLDLLKLDDHRITTDIDAMPEIVRQHAGQLRGRSMLCRRAEPLPVECVARGYLAGSGWKAYQSSGGICGVALPPGLRESDALPEPIFTPATKAGSGHDENVDFVTVADLLGAERAVWLRRATLAIYARLAAHARERGIIVADTKLEFGLVDGRIILIDEVGTPDSSRFWPAERYRPGGPQASFDKQYVRDWLLSSGWDRVPPAPALPDEVVAATRARYVAAYEHLTGRPFAEWRG
ncbi:MAG: phosphoribosylaminoimidazolesuccinocarboxamide synthase [Egibacteraceae bacterium]